MKVLKSLVAVAATISLAMFAMVATASSATAATLTWTPTGDIAASGVSYTPRVVYRADGSAVVAWLSAGVIR
ncbi:MAG: hypothetical protein WCI74_15055, partial [Actinomycetes bacterium]